MLQLPGNLTAESFLARYWQKNHLFMPHALPHVRPAISRNELAWLATLDDVEARLVFTERGAERLRYVAETGPFDPDYLAALPRRDWTPVSYTHLTLPTNIIRCRSRWSPCH